MNTKKMLVLPACLLLIFFGCRKSSSAGALPPNTFIADVNGVTETFSARIIATRIDNNTTNPGNPPYSISLVGYSVDSFYSDDMQILINNTTPILPGTYKYRASADFNSAIFLVFTQNPSDFDYTPGDNGLAAITITSINSTNVQGTFSGNLLGTNNRSRTITNGRFNLNFK